MRWRFLARRPNPNPLTPAHAQDDGDHNEPFVAFALEVSLSKCPPAVFSISYTDEEDSATHRYAKRFAVEMAKAVRRRRPLARSLARSLLLAAATRCYYSLLLAALRVLSRSSAHSPHHHHHHHHHHHLLLLYLTCFFPRT